MDRPVAEQAMRVLLINPPYQTITSNWGVGHQVPLGLLMVGGTLQKHGHQVSLLDAEAQHLGMDAIVAHMQRIAPDLVMTGHAGSTPAHPICTRMLRTIKQACPQVVTVYGGVFPTYHDRSTLAEHPCIDIIVRGEGEAIAAELVDALAQDKDLRDVPGITWRCGQTIIRNEPAPDIADLDAHPVGWQLIDDWDRYQCFGKGRAAIVQFSRGCPHRCTYCGQHSFWSKWRHRDPQALAGEIAWLHRAHDVRFVTLADENPTTHPRKWRAFLEALAAEQVDVHLFATIRATDIHRDAHILHLYREAGLLYVLMGIETTDPQVLRRVRKGSTTRDDYAACQLLKREGIYSIIGHIVGLDEETWRDFRKARQALAQYDGDYLNAMYVTPHTWTAYAREQAGRAVVQPDQQRWDYRNQVLEQRYMRPWQLFLAVKWLELAFHLRPRRLVRLFCDRERFRRRQARWTGWHTARVWVMELVDFFVRTRFAGNPLPLARWLDAEREGSDSVPLTISVPAVDSAALRGKAGVAGASGLHAGAVVRSALAPADHAVWGVPDSHPGDPRSGQRFFLTHNFS